MLKYFFECVVVLITYFVYEGTFIGFYFAFDILVEGLRGALNHILRHKFY
jgi:hypothetical protein